MDIKVFLEQELSDFISSTSKSVASKIKNPDLVVPLNNAHTRLHECVSQYLNGDTIKKLNEEEYNIILYFLNVYREHLRNEKGLVDYIHRFVNPSTKQYIDSIETLYNLRKIVITEFYN